MGQQQRSLLAFWKKRPVQEEDASGPCKAQKPGEAPDGSQATTGAGQQAEEACRVAIKDFDGVNEAGGKSELEGKLVQVERREEAKFKEVGKRFAWLEEGNVKDSKGRPKSHPDHDARTLSLPNDLKLSASQRQYWDIKRQYRDVITFIRIGSFYELYEDDAEIGARELGWRLTVSGVGNCRQVGCPASGVDRAVASLVAKGYKVAKVEQMESAKEAKARAGNSACIRRELSNVHSLPTLTEGSVDGADLPQTAVHVLALVEKPTDTGVEIGFAVLEAAAGRSFVGETHDTAERSSLGALISQISPTEVLFPKGNLSQATRARIKSTAVSLTALEPPSECPSPPTEREPVEAFFQETRFAHSRGGCKNDALESASPLTLASVCCLSSHLRRLQSEKELAGAADVLPYDIYSGCVRLPGSAATDLELIDCEGSVFSQLNRCITSIGVRALRNLVVRPERSVDKVKQRQEAVRELMNSPDVLDGLRSELRQCHDLERALGRLRAFRDSPSPALPSDLLEHQRKKRANAVASLIAAASRSACALERLSGAQASELQSIAASAESARRVAQAVQDAVAHVEKSEADINEKDEDAATSAQISAALEHHQLIKEASANLASADVVAALSTFGSDALGPMCLPTIIERASGESPSFKASSLRSLCAKSEGMPVPNDVYLGGDGGKPTSMLLTGPNMGGKSTLMRAVCTAAALAHMGAPVPAERVEMTAVDAIFTRIGARDDLATGMSTFLVECMEASTMLRRASEDSLLLVDELGRGTATTDGYSIAKASLSKLLESPCPRLLFSTHYHRLTEDFAHDPRVQLCHMACTLGQDGRVVFLYRLEGGSCPRSHGLSVARMAGMPSSVVERAQEVVTPEDGTAEASPLSLTRSIASACSHSDHSELMLQWRLAQKMK